MSTVKNIFRSISRRLFVISFVTTLAISSTAQQPSCSLQPSNVEPPAGAAVVITDIEFRNDLTRVHAYILGRPHTSGKFDNFTLSAINGPTLEFTDIDGIDADRYFQWEDDGKIYVEIDFPPTEQDGIMVLKLMGKYTLAAAVPTNNLR
ncbi:MAG: hypothetical protein NC230_04480 [Bacteroides sp.]|nr:hypothetical protein [Bacteroides sp.]